MNRRGTLYGFINLSRQYFAKAIASGPGRRGGIVQSDGDTPIEFRIGMPKVTGGQAEGPNPEQLFAMVYTCESREHPRRALRSGQKY